MSNRSVVLYVWRKPDRSNKLGQIRDKPRRFHSFQWCCWIKVPKHMKYDFAIMYQHYSLWNYNNLNVAELKKSICNVKEKIKLNQCDKPKQEMQTIFSSNKWISYSVIQHVLAGMWGICSKRWDIDYWSNVHYTAGLREMHGMHWIFGQVHV